LIQIDRILEFLRDFQWHSIEEIKKEICISDEKLIKVLYFLQEQSLINKENEMVRITPKGSTFLELPS
jgi:predicted transcriptional regulator